MISILLPIYNGIEFIEESVGSVLAQTFTEWELLVGINGHSPNSEVYQIAKKYEDIYNNQEKEKKIRVFDFFYIKGKSNTLNEVIKHCNYNYVALIDVDDIWNCKKLEIQVPFLKLNYHVVGSQCVYFGDRFGSPFIPLEDFSQYNFKQSNPIINSSVIIKKELCYWREDTILEDYDLWLRLRKQEKRFYNCKEILVKHRIHQESSFNSKGNSNHVQCLLNYHFPEK
jgi:glycosyltransferase involved in cell wall biosynthesis